MRAFTPYEQNQLKKHTISLAAAQKYGDMPMEYITGFAEFGGSDFAVNPNVLIPRVESMQIVDTAINYCSTVSDQPLMIADVGCGSGAVGISFFLELRKRGIDCKMFLSDVSQKALQVTKVNVKRLIPKKFQKNITVLKGNLLTQYPKTPQPPKFDLILANLPYIPSARLLHLPSSVKNYEPMTALDGGIKGLQLIKALIRQAPNYLKENGVMILEIDYKHKIADFAEFKNFKKEIRKDCFGRNRFLLLRRL